jgi:hypothetical protein
MKYIINYKKFNENKSESYLENSSINWDIIQTAKDIALEYIDDGLELEFSVDYYQPGTSTPGPFLVIGGVFSQKEDSIEWNKSHFDEDEILDKDNIVYSFYYDKLDNYKIDYNSFKDLTIQLNNRLVEMYPDEKFEDFG